MDETGPATQISSTTEWYSTWQTNDPLDSHRWATEVIVMADENGRFSFHSVGNDLGYTWEGIGEVHHDYYMSGIWQTTKNSPSAGSFMLHATDSQGRMRTGFLLGPTKGDRKNFGAWVLVRKDSTVSDLAAAQNQLEAAKAHLAISMCPGLGDLVKYSDGQFLEDLLHPALQPAFTLLKNAQTEAAVGAAFVQLEHYVSKASERSGLPMLHLMETVFKPGGGELSNGTIQSGDRLESSTQARMRDLFTGSLYVRNLYGHSPPKTSFTEAAVLLMFATYLYRLVDSQVIKRGRPPVVI